MGLIMGDTWSLDYSSPGCKHEQILDSASKTQPLQRIRGDFPKLEIPFGGPYIKAYTSIWGFRYIAVHLFWESATRQHDQEALTWFHHMEGLLGKSAVSRLCASSEFSLNTSGINGKGAHTEFPET